MKKEIRCLICIMIGIILYGYSISNSTIEGLDSLNESELNVTTEVTIPEISETTEEITTEKSTVEALTTQETTTKELATKKLTNYIDCDVPKNNTIKSYMNYKAITSINSKQYKLQKSLAYTDNNGLRMVGDRYCVALGSYYTATIGQHVDIELENGKIIKGILADCKADIHTDSTNRINPNGSVVEFIVNVDVLDDVAKRRGDISCINGWDSKVVNIRVYDTIEKF